MLDLAQACCSIPIRRGAGLIDSRAPIEQVFNAAIGDLFHRTGPTKWCQEDGGSQYASADQGRFLRTLLRVGFSSKAWRMATLASWRITSSPICRSNEAKVEYTFGYNACVAANVTENVICTTLPSPDNP